MRYTINSVPIDAATRQEALNACRGFLCGSAPHLIVTINPEMVVEAQKNIKFRAVLQKSDLALADGIGVAWAARWLWGIKPERISGVDFMVDLCALAEREGASVFFLGGRGGVSEKTAEAMQEQFSKLRVAGSSEEPPIDLAIRHVDILFVAFGAPKQELWIAEHLPDLSRVKIAMGVGGAFDMISGNKKRAPRAMRKLGLEWLWRLALQPSRIHRIFRAIVMFPLLVMRRRPEAL